MMKLSSILGRALLVLATMSMIGLFACREKQAPPAQEDVISMETLATVLDKADAEKSGIADLTKTDQGLVVKYHLYVPTPQDFDAVIGEDLAPKIERLYRTFKTIDNVTFDVETIDPGWDNNWRPYCSFDMTRKIYEQLNWTNLLASDLFKVCKVDYSRQ